MRSSTLTIAVATTGAGLICLAPAANADGPTLNPGGDTLHGTVKVTVGLLIPCIKVGAPGGMKVGELAPCVRVGSPAATNVADHNPNIKRIGVDPTG